MTTCDSVLLNAHRLAPTTGPTCQEEASYTLHKRPTFGDGAKSMSAPIPGCWRHVEGFTTNYNYWVAPMDGAGSPRHSWVNHWDIDQVIECVTMTDKVAHDLMWKVLCAELVPYGVPGVSMAVIWESLDLTTQEALTTAVNHEGPGCDFCQADMLTDPHKCDVCPDKAFCGPDCLNEHMLLEGDKGVPLT